AESGPEIAVLKGHTDSVTSATFSPNGKGVLTVSRDNTARLWDTESGNEIAVLKGHTGGVVSAAFSPDGKRVMTRVSAASADNPRWEKSRAGKDTARLWDAESGKKIAVLKGHTGRGWSAASSRDGKRVLTETRAETAD